MSQFSVTRNKGSAKGANSCTAVQRITDQMKCQVAVVLNDQYHRCGLCACQAFNSTVFIVCVVPELRFVWQTERTKTQIKKSRPCFFHSGSLASTWTSQIYAMVLLEVTLSCKAVGVLLAVLLFSGGMKVGAFGGKKGSEGAPGRAQTQLHVPFKAVALQQLANALLTCKKVSTSTAAAAAAAATGSVAAVIGSVGEGCMC